MTFAECPLCDTATSFVEEDGAIECAPCGVRLELAAEAPALELALAA